MKLDLYIKGVADYKSGLAGWGLVLRDAHRGRETWRNGVLRDKTFYEAEREALFNGLKLAYGVDFISGKIEGGSLKEINVYTDSPHMINGWLREARQRDELSAVFSRFEQNDVKIWFAKTPESARDKVKYLARKEFVKEQEARGIPSRKEGKKRVYRIVKLTGNEIA